jgi:hypothetical protein
MTETPPNAPPRRRASGAIPGLAALAAVACLAVTLYGLVWRTAPAEPEIQIPVLIAGGGGAIIAAVLAYFRSMSVADVLEALWEAVLALFALAGAILKGIWAFVLGLLGWD